MKKLLVVLPLITLCSVLCVSQNTASHAKKPTKKSAPCSEQISKAFKREALLAKVAIDQLKEHVEDNRQIYNQYGEAVGIAMAKVEAEATASSLCEATFSRVLAQYQLAVAKRRFDVAAKSDDIEKYKAFLNASDCIDARFKGDDTKCGD